MSVNICIISYCLLQDGTIVYYHLSFIIIWLPFCIFTCVSVSVSYSLIKAGAVGRRPLTQTWSRSCCIWSVWTWSQRRRAGRADGRSKWAFRDEKWWWQQQAGESVSTNLEKLRKMVAPCEFGDSLSRSLNDCLVCGFRNEKRLLSEPELTLDKAQAICHSLETAELNAQTLRGSDTMLKQLSQDRRQRIHSQSQRRGKTPPHNAQHVWECFCCVGIVGTLPG